MAANLQHWIYWAFKQTCSTLALWICIQLTCSRLKECFQNLDFIDTGSFRVWSHHIRGANYIWRPPLFGYCHQSNRRPSIYFHHLFLPFTSLSFFSYHRIHDKIKQKVCKRHSRSKALADSRSLSSWGDWKACCSHSRTFENRCSQHHVELQEYRQAMHSQKDTK